MHLRANPCSEDRIALKDLIYRNRLVQIPPRCLLVLRCSPENVDLSAFLRRAMKLITERFERSR
jgi:hypothetical protein